MATVGIIVNPHAGKDVRRLVSAAGHTSDSVKIGIVRRAIAGAFEAGAKRIILSADTHRLGERAADGLGAPVELLDGPMTSSRLDTVTAAQEMWKAEARCVISLGGDGTCRDIAIGWPQAPLIAISTGTNNVFPGAIDGTSGGVAAGLVATGAIDAASVGTTAKRVAIRIDDPRVGATGDDTALVEVALVDGSFVGARAVSRPASIRWVVACIAEPASTGLASIAGRVHPIGRDEPGGVFIRLGPGGRQVRVPIAPGSFETLAVADVQPLPSSTPVELPGDGMLAYDGERTTPVSSDAAVTLSIENTGPTVIDVDKTLRLAAEAQMFELTPTGDDHRKDTDGH